MNFRVKFIMAFHENQLKQLEDHQKPVIGCFPMYPPVELFHSMCLKPVVLWGFKDLFDNTHRSDEHIQDFVCSIGRHLIEFVLSKYGGILDCIFFYNTCDCLRNTPEILQEGLKRKDDTLPFFNFHLPMNSLTKEYAQDYLKNEINLLIDDLESSFDNKFDYNVFKESISLYDRMRELSMELENLIIQNNHSYKHFIRTAAKLNYLDIEEQIELLKTTIAQLKSKPVRNNMNSKNKVLISGIMPPPLKIITIMEKFGLKIVGNDTGFLSRFLSRTPEESSYNSVGSYYVEFYKNHFPCSTLLYSADTRQEKITELVKSSNAKGVIFIGEKFCEYEYFEFPTLQDVLKNENIPSLLLEFSIEDTFNIEAYKTRIQSFQEILNNK